MFQALMGLFLLQGSFALAVTRYENVVTRMEQIAKNYPAQAQIFTLAQNDQGLPIKGLKIGNGTTNSLVVATHHGNEYGSTEVGLGLAQSLAQAPIKDQTVWVIPVLNISGYNANKREEKNAKGWVDSNRDYTGPCVTGKQFRLRSTAALAQFLSDKNIVISATLHTFFPAVVYPWGISTLDLSTPYDTQYKKLVAAATKESGYRTGNITEVLYAVDGSFEDYAYWKYGIWSLLFELGFSHTPDSQSMVNMVSVNNPGIRRFLETAPKQRVAAHSFTGQCDLSRSFQRLFPE